MYTHAHKHTDTHTDACMHANSHTLTYTDACMHANAHRHTRACMQHYECPSWEVGELVWVDSHWPLPGLPLTNSWTRLCPSLLKYQVLKAEILQDPAEKVRA